MPTDQQDPHRRIDGLQHEFNMLRTTTKADLQTAKSEAAVSYERLQAAITELRKDTYKAMMGGALGIVILLGFLITILDRNSPPAPTVIYQQAPSAYQPPATSVLPDPN